MTSFEIVPSQSKIEFQVKHLMISKVHGRFRHFHGSFDGSQVEVTIDVASISTNDSSRDDHLTGPDFFNAKKFPSISFISSTIRGREVTGELSIRGVTRKIILELTKPLDLQKALTVQGKTKIERKSFGLSWNAAIEAGGVLVGDDISISFEVVLNPRPL